ncbi:MAG TPA: tetratricopeptide repeat protein [Polyangiaceae bacterium]
MSRRSALVLGCAALLGVSRANAAPTLWQRAEEPERAAEYTGLLRLERALERAQEASAEPALVPEVSMGGLLLMQLSHLKLDKLKDPRLCYLVAKALIDVESAPPDEVHGVLERLLTRRPDPPLLEARRLLERALSAEPNSPLAAMGSFNLALIEGKLGDHARERAAYLRAIELEWDPDMRATDYANLAESEMMAGNLVVAISYYRTALVNAGGAPDVQALAYYGLALALERSGDLPRALASAELGNRIELPLGLFPTKNALDLPSVSFSPPYELHYYKALAAMADAQSAHEPESRRDALANAIEHWEAYLVMAELDHTPWLQNARLREARARRDLAAVDAKSSSGR